MRWIVLAFALLFSTGASAQCSGVFPNQYMCGNNSGASAPPAPIPFNVFTSAQVDALCSTNNNFLLRSAGIWGCGSAGTGLAISGTALNLQPSAALTIGGVESYVAVTHQWINTISTAGVPSSTQPAFSDLSGSATNAQLPGTGTTTVDGQSCQLNGSCQTAISGQSDYTATTWTPAITTTSTAGTPAYSVQVGSYERLGRQVTVRFAITLSGWTGSPTGNVEISGLPVTSANVANDSGICVVGQYAVAGLAASTLGITGVISPNSAIIVLLQSAGTASNFITAAQAGTTATFIGWCNYHT